MHKGLEIRHMAPPTHQPKHPELQWVHQTAPSNPDKWHRMWHQCQPSWKKLAEDNGMQYKLWSDEELDSFVKSEYPDFYDCCYSQYPAKIQKIDAARPLILHRYGGIYADMDTTCRRQLHPLFTPEDRVVVAVEKDEPGQYQILQWCFAARPGQPVFLRMLDEIVVRHNYMKDKPVHQRDKDDLVIWKTGPALFTEYLLRAKKQDDKAVTIHPRCTFGAYDLSSACLDKAYLVHHFDGSWKENWQESFKLWGDQ